MGEKQVWIQQKKLSQKHQSWVVGTSRKEWIAVQIWGT